MGLCGGSMTPRKWLWLAWALHAALAQTYSIIAAVTAKRLLPYFRAQKFGGPLRVLLRNLQAVLSASFLLVNLLTWTTFLLILGKSVFKKGFGSAPGLLVGCSIGCCFATWLALFFTSAQMQSGYLLTKDLLNDSDSQLFQACFGLGFFTGIVYLFFAAAMFWLRSVMIGGALAAQEEALKLREQELRERERSGRRGFFGRGRTEPEPTPEPPAPAPSRITNPMAGLLGRGNAAAPAPSAAPAFASAAPTAAAPAPAPAPAPTPAAAPAAFSNSNPWA